MSSINLFAFCVVVVVVVVMVVVVVKRDVREIDDDDQKPYRSGLLLRQMDVFSLDDPTDRPIVDEADDGRAVRRSSAEMRGRLGRVELFAGVKCGLLFGVVCAVDDLLDRDAGMTADQDGR